MPVPQRLASQIVDEILKEKTIEEVEKRMTLDASRDDLPESLPREAVYSKEAQSQRLKILRRHGIKFSYVSGKKRIYNPKIFQGNIENYIGLAQLPLGVIGPLRIKGVNANGDFYVPLATTEGALIASYNRGARVISLSGGARVLCLTERVSRAPGFIFRNMVEAGQFIVWCVKKLEKFKQIAKTTTSHGELKEIRTTLEGNLVFINFEYTTGDASGQNIVTIATEEVCRYIVENCPIKPQQWFIESNMSGDKKASAISYLYVRGKKVVAETIIPRKIVARLLHTTPEALLEYWKVSFVGGVQSGSIGVQGHYANGLAALFIACGQDVASVAEASMGITRVDVTKEGDAYISVSLPNLIVGTVGGGTNLPTQQECLAMLGCKGAGTARKFAEICAVTILAGEISIMAALASGQFVQAHQKYGRKRR